MSRAPLRATAIRETAPDPVKKKSRLRKQAAQRSLLDIDADIVNSLKAQGIDLQWVTDSVLGQTAPQSRMAFEINAWEAVTPDMFDGVFDGMFTRRGHTGEINYDGLVLMWRPLELTEEAIREDQEARNNALSAQRGMMMDGIIPNLSASHNPNNPKAHSQITRKITPPMDIPTE